MSRKEKSVVVGESNIPTIGEVLRFFRQEKGFSLAEMAKILGYTKGYLSGVENGHKQASLELLSGYEQKLGFEPDALSKAFRIQTLGVSTTEHQITFSHLSSIRNVPYLHNPFFTGREGILNQLFTTLATAKQVPPACVLTGPVGIGKTQIANKYLYRNKRNYQAIFWLRANSYEILASDLANIAEGLSLSKKENLSRGQIIHAAKNWLNKYTKYLLIIDGLDNPEDVSTVYNFISQVSGHIILTSRMQAPMQKIPYIQVEQMTMEESALFLLRLTRVISFDSSLVDASETDLNNALKIARMLGGLPLVLEQTGTFIKEVGCGLFGYLELYCSHQPDLLGRLNG